MNDDIRSQFKFSNFLVNLLNSIAIAIFILGMIFITCSVVIKITSIINKMKKSKLVKLESAQVFETSLILENCEC